MARKASRPVFSSLPAQRPQTKLTNRKTKKSAKRSLEAFAIANAENPEGSSLRASRLGQREDSPAGARKRRRQEEDEDSEHEWDGSEQEAGKPRKRQAKDKSQNDEMSEGSDSEGNNWRLGHVDNDDDTEVDSDEAFDDDDEERFSGWTFGASSSSKRSSQNVKGRNVKFDQDEDGNSLGEDDDDDDSLGEDAVDLAQMLDDYEPSDEEMNEAQSDQSQSFEEDAESEEDDVEDSQFSGFSEDEEDDDEDTDMKDNKLQKLISDIHPKTDQKSSSASLIYESSTPTAAGPITKEKFDINSLLASTSDPNLASLIKRVGNVPKQLKNDPKLAPSLPKRQKDKLERIAASKLTEKQLGKWVDSVKHIRRAEHLSFPLVDPEAAPVPGSEHIMPAIAGKPINDLEEMMNNILQESGLAANDEDDGVEGDEYDELPENNVTLDEILARRSDLRRARELMFQEEKRAKRIKKIKSKTYRRIHRKERQRQLANLEALEDDGSSMDEEEKAEHDRRRAEDRMNTKHRDSKWAKQMKKSGRTIWDGDAKSGVIELARRNEELRRRIAGKDVQSDEDRLSSDEDADLDEGFKLRSLSDKLDTLMQEEEPGKNSRLASMAFMKKAEQARKAESDAAVRRMKKDLEGESFSEAESSDENVGRKIFGPQSRRTEPIKEIRNEFEAPDDSDVDDLDDFAPVVDPTITSNDIAASSTSKAKSRFTASKSSTSGNVSLANQASSTRSTAIAEHLPGEIHSAPDADGWVTVSYEKKVDKEIIDDDAQSDVSQSSIFQRAFAGDDDLEAQFAGEKADVAVLEEEKFEDDTLTGWGTWVGEGISGRERKRDEAIMKRRREKLIRKTEDGVKAQDRKDAHLKNVIISQKRIKNNTGYLATQLPFPFKNRAEYERSIRMPVGGEWNVTKSFQENTKPRVMVKQGHVVKPMERPIV